MRSKTLVRIFALALVLGTAFLTTGSAKLLTTDPLTGLPLYPATDSRLHLGNQPTRLPDWNVCNRKAQADFYSVFDSKVDATLAWYAAHLSGFKKTHAYSAQRSQDAFYNADGTVVVSVTGSPGKPGENTDAYAVIYMRFQPALTEGMIVTLNQERLVCK